MTDDMESTRLRERLADMAAEAAEATGDERFARAAGVLRGKRSGRRVVDDTKPLAYVAKLFNDDGLSKNSACIRAAIIYSPTPHAIDAMIARLLRKFSQN